MQANEFAGSFLVPDDDFLNDQRTKKYIETNENRFITNLVNLYKVSGEVICRRMVVNGIMTENEYDKKRKDFQKGYEQDELRQKKKREESKKIFIPDYYRDIVKSSGYDLSRKAFSAASEGKISTNELVTFLGVKLTGLKKVFKNTQKHYKGDPTITSRI